MEHEEMNEYLCACSPTSIFLVEFVSYECPMVEEVWAHMINFSQKAVDVNVFPTVHA